jgi:hypothetical protein
VQVASREREVIAPRTAAFLYIQTWFPPSIILLPATCFMQPPGRDSAADPPSGLARPRINRCARACSLAISAHYNAEGGCRSLYHRVIGRKNNRGWFRSLLMMIFLQRAHFSGGGRAAKLTRALTHTPAIESEMVALKRLSHRKFCAEEAESPSFTVFYQKVVFLIFKRIFKPA